MSIKALDRLIYAVAELGEEYRSKIHVDIVGEGEEFDSISKIIEEYNLTDTIKMHGFILDSTSFFHNADIFILPSHMEGLSIALLEAMSYGIACIINNFGVPFDDSVVYKLENNEPSTIANVIKKFVDKPELIQKYGSDARKEVMNNFSVKAFANNYFKIYKTCFISENLSAKPSSLFASDEIVHTPNN